MTRMRTPDPEREARLAAIKAALRPAFDSMPATIGDVKEIVAKFTEAFEMVGEELDRLRAEVESLKAGRNGKP